MLIFFKCSPGLCPREIRVVKCCPADTLFHKRGVCQLSLPDNSPHRPLLGVARSARGDLSCQRGDSNGDLNCFHKKVKCMVKVRSAKADFFRVVGCRRQTKDSCKPKLCQSATKRITKMPYEGRLKSFEPSHEGCRILLWKLVCVMSNQTNPCVPDFITLSPFGFEVRANIKARTEVTNVPKAWSQNSFSRLSWKQILKFDRGGLNCRSSGSG